MNIILVGKCRGKAIRCQIGAGAQMLLFGMLIIALAGMVASVGFWLGSSTTENSQFTELEGQLSKQKDLIHTARSNAQSELDTLTLRIGNMQAHVTRLDALGERLIKVANLDASEFDFAHKPAIGGPSAVENGLALDFENVMSELTEQLDSREQQLYILEDVIINSQLKKDSHPSGRPVNSGWISSYYGQRTDPFSGKLEHHKGMDFASKEGSKINAVSSGIVTWASKRYGYGNLVEINHGHGYTTRYGHNAEILVEVGDIVERGQPISLMGSTGRSTGPHVHFEVLVKDRQVDPLRYVQSES